MSRIVIFVFSLSFLISSTYGQVPGGGMTPPEFHAEEAAGIFYYDSDKVTKKLKITDEVNKQKAMEALFVYNERMSELSAENASDFKKLEDAFNEKIQIAFQNRDRSVMNEVRAEIQTKIPPIRQQVNDQEIILNDAMEVILTDKQNKKWLKYQRQQKGSTPFN